MLSERNLTLVLIFQMQKCPWRKREVDLQLFLPTGLNLFAFVIHFPQNMPQLIWECDLKLCPYEVQLRLCLFHIKTGISSLKWVLKC